MRPLAKSWVGQVSGDGNNSDGSITRAEPGRVRGGGQCNVSEKLCADMASILMHRCFEMHAETFSEISYVKDVWGR